jgi:hypothetical protein
MRRRVRSAKARNRWSTAGADTVAFIRITSPPYPMDPDAGVSNPVGRAPTPTTRARVATEAVRWFFIVASVLVERVRNAMILPAPICPKSEPEYGGREPYE